MDEPDEFRKFFEVASGPLVRVIAIGRAVEDVDVTVELIALEVRAAGSILHWKAHPAREQQLGDIGDIDAVVTDDLGTIYSAFSSRVSGTDSDRKGELTITPVPPADASSMRIQIRGFGSLGMFLPVPDRDRLQGKWEFEFSTRT